MNSPADPSLLTAPTTSGLTIPAPYRPTPQLARVCSIDDLRRLARRRLPRAVFDFFDGGAEDEVTLEENRAAFRRVDLVPAVLRGVAQVDLSTALVGAPAALPLIVGPTGAAGFGWPRGDIAIARAAYLAGVPYVLSTSATASIEDIARAAPGRLWFQAYILKRREHTMHLIERARAAGYEGLMITVDLPVGGKRERDLRNDFSIPFRYTARNVFDFATHPRWALPMLWQGMPMMESFRGLDGLEAGTGLKAANRVATSVGRNYDPTFNWDDLAQIRERWSGKLIIKGIMRPSDALRAAQIGCDAIVVSNHGGRQLDGGMAALKALPAVAQAAGDRIQILMDGGIRRGGDIVKAMALGAQGVLVGRATLYGACAAGENGARHALDILRDELVRTLQLCGIARVADIDQSVVEQG